MNLLEMLVINIFKFIVYSGLSLWMTIACINNFIDTQTNKHNLLNMMRMTLLKNNDDGMGQGLISRSISNNRFSELCFRCVLWYQLTICILMVIGSIFFLYTISINPQIINYSLTFINITLCLFALLWLFFICGGLYFGYWIKTPQFQQVHFTLLILSILIFFLMNLRTY